MKKLRMIVTSVVVLAIVGGAFAFKVKQANYCVSTNSTSNCSNIVPDLKITTVTENSTVYSYYPNWLGLVSECTGASGDDKCTGQIRLTGN